MGGSGHASYEDAHDVKYGEPFLVPLLIANEENIKEFGQFVDDYDKEEVLITQWPQQGRRPICAGTGAQGGVAEGLFRYKWDNGALKAVNEAVELGDYMTGMVPMGSDPVVRTHVLTREANYHPDGGQVFFPYTKGEPFVALLAPPVGDDVKLSDFRAFYFEGSQGLQIYAGVWHQPMYPVNDEMIFKGKQGRVHACVVFDSVDELGKFMLVPLSPTLAENKVS